MIVLWWCYNTKHLLADYEGKAAATICYWAACI